MLRLVVSLARSHTSPKKHFRSLGRHLTIHLTRCACRRTLLRIVGREHTILDRHACNTWLKSHFKR